ncbi:MAG: GYD domain-containing protein [Caldilineaceae bacterium]|nr:GYD domain-containing protein [Caldilineaceae bacterium]
MAKYLLQASYTVDGVKGLLKEGGSARRAVVERLATSLGGTVESFYYAFGENDLYVISEFPDNVAAAAIGLTVVASGAVSCKTTVLLTAEEIDAATRTSPTYQPPGQ